MPLVLACLHDDEILGKAYDSRLMRRLLGYLWPYRWQAALALARDHRELGGCSSRRRI